MRFISILILTLFSTLSFAEDDFETALLEKGRSIISKAESCVIDFIHWPGSRDANSNATANRLKCDNQLVFGPEDNFPEKFEYDGSQRYFLFREKIRSIVLLNLHLVECLSEENFAPEKSNCFFEKNRD